jgi:autotransporter-associated beta strand protein
VNQDAALFYGRMRANPEFRLAFADRVHRHFFHGGALTPEQTVARYRAAADAMELAVIAESARWGSYRRDKHSYLNDPSRVQAPAILYTRDTHWVAERDRLLDTYLPQRSAVVLQQFINANLYPAVAAPVFQQHGGTLAAGEPVTLGAAAGTIHYTLDGSDPRDPSAAIYSAPIPLAGPATIKARAFHNGQWSALLEANFVPADIIPEFQPAGSTDWTDAGNWSTPFYPDGAGKAARVFAPIAGDRNINLYAPVTIGSILFDQGNGPYRDRVRDRSIGNSLTFDGGSTGDARIEVTGSGTGFVEFEFDSECILASNLVLDVRNTAGNPEHGALRLRTRWSGPGGLIKRSAGVASLTGEDKLFSGPLVIESGVLQITGPATPVNTAGVTVNDGGQLRLISSGTFSAPSIHTFGAAIALAGKGRTGVPDGEGFGVLGALRYEPVTSGSRAVVTTPVHLAAPAAIHVANADNQLDLSGPLSGTHALAKSGGGTLVLGGNSSNFTGDLDIANGTVAIDHNMMVGGVSGQGVLFIDDADLTVEILDGVGVRMVFSSTEALENPTITANTASPGTLWIHLGGALATMGSRIQGGFILPPGSHWSQVLDDVRVLVPDISGEHSFAGQNWSIHPSAGVTRMPVTAGDQAAEILEIRIGGGPLDFDAWRTAAFPSPTDLADPAVSGLMATPFGDGIPNVLRFALGVSGGDPVSHALPHLTPDIPPVFRFPYDPGLTGLVWTVQATNDLSDWSQADILFNSAANPSLPDPDGMLAISDPHPGNQRRFYRLAVSACAP